MYRTRMFAVLGLAFCLTPSSLQADPLPNTQLLTAEGDLAAKMVDGMHKYLDRENAASVGNRKALWKTDFTTPDAYAKSVAPNRERLKHILGVVDRRSTPRLEYVGGTGSPSALVAETPRFKAYTVRWSVLPGVDGEGLLLEPTTAPVYTVVAIPDAGQTPEQIAGLAPGVPPEARFARRFAENGVRVVIPVLIDRQFNLIPRTNQPHREFVHRMAYEMGRTLLGYEVQKVLALVDWFLQLKSPSPVGVFGYGEGGRVALYAGAIDTRITATGVSGAFGPREKIDLEPIYHNVWALLTEFGDGDLLHLIVPRAAVIEAVPFEAAAGPPSAQGRGGAAPGRTQAAPPEAVKAEMDRVLNPLVANWKGDRRPMLFFAPPAEQQPVRGPGLPETVKRFLELLTSAEKPIVLAPVDGDVVADTRPEGFQSVRHKRQFEQLVAFTQKLWRDSDATRKTYFAKADASSPTAWEKSTESYRDYFHSEVIGKLPEPTGPLNPRTRQVYDEKTWTGHEVMLDVYPDVFAYGILLLPKDLKPGEKRPVVVCQHGLEGTPRHTIDPEKYPIYAEFSKKLVEQGYIVYAPQNPYYGENTFRQLQRKANPLKLSLFSFIIRQHQRTLDWLETLPNVDPKRIGFYGLSYGGKTAVRVPAVEKRYCLSICSGDFNEWIGKNVSVDLDRSYMWTREYEMYEFDLGNTFNYAEMAYLIAPRPFMVERGHDDGVGTDEMVSYEFAKVRYLYANRLKIADRTEIEYQAGGHRIFGKGSYAFLAKHLKWTPK
ncbi:MAG: Alpha/beta hydrolase family protein [Gemmataceae bacterium]|nr:Alpha/beta hydrolase family protein [Gemmataceae bacterium]